MPEIANINRIKQDEKHKWAWHLCIDCRKGRWVQLRNGKPRSLRCRRCANQGKNLKYDQINRQGYIFLLCKKHPAADCWGYVKRARLVLEEKLGRYLLPGMDVHHKNGIKDDDRPDNLEEIIPGEHTSLHRPWLYRNKN
jgi:hypothetical protein